MTPFSIAFGPWAPDLQNVATTVQNVGGAVPVPCADCLNVFFANGVYQSLPTPQAQATALPGLVNCAFTFIDASGTAVPIAGVNQGSAYYHTAAGWSIANNGPGSALFDYNFCQFGPQLFIQPRVNLLQYYLQGSGLTNPLLVTEPAIGAGTLTPQVVNGAPNASVLATVGQFVMVGNTHVFQQETIATGDGTTATFNYTVVNPPIQEGVAVVTAGSIQVAADPHTGMLSGAGVVSGQVNYGTGTVSITYTSPPAIGVPVTLGYATPYTSRVAWSAIGNPTNWPTPLTQAALAAQSGYQDLESQYGPVLYIAGYPLYALIFQQNAITRASYQGGAVVFAFQTFARNRGLLTIRAVVQVGDTVYFLSDSGFFATDGANVWPIGSAPDNSMGIDNWFWSNVNRSVLGNIRAGYDAVKRCVFFAIPTGANTTPDTLLSYNTLAQRWTKSAMAIEHLWTDYDFVQGNRLGIFPPNHTYSLLTGTANKGYLESCDVTFTDTNTRYCTGVRPNLNCTDIPSVIVGNRNTLSAGVQYSNPANIDPFSGTAPVLTSGIYTRTRITSGAGQAFHGATLYLQPGGPV